MKNERNILVLNASKSRKRRKKEEEKILYKISEIFSHLKTNNAESKEKW